MHIADLVQAQRSFYDHGKTRNLAFRAVALERLAREMHAREHRFLRALRPVSYTHLSLLSGESSGSHQ